jgi:hypothetical protein
MIEVRKEKNGMWSVYDDDGWRVVSYHSQDAAEWMRGMLQDDKEYERARKEESEYTHNAGIR